MPTKIALLMQKRAANNAEANKIVDNAEAEDRNLNSEELARHDQIVVDMSDLSERIERQNVIIAQERSLAEDIADNQENLPGNESKNKIEDEARAMNAVIMGFICRGVVDEELIGAFGNEWRALQTGTDTLGGYTVMPEQFVNQMIKFVDDMLVIRQLATIFKVPKAQSLGAPSLDTDPDDSDWTTELATGSEDSNMKFGKRELHPHPLAKQIKISNALLRQSEINMEAFVISRLTYKNGLAQEKAYMTGDGSGKPLGLFTASAQGISTARDVSTDNTTTSITFDGLINAKYNNKSQYHGASSAWLFHRDALKQITKLKDGEGQYLWQPSVQVGQPDTILGNRVIMSENVPNTFTTGLFVGMFGDFSNYWIADALDYRVQRLVELHALTNQTGFITRSAHDGMPVLEEAFTRVKLA